MLLGVTVEMPLILGDAHAAEGVGWPAGCNSLPNVEQRGGRRGANVAQH